MNKYGWIRSLPDQRDFKLNLRSPIGLPSEVDLRPHCPPVFDQGQVGSCTANAIVAAQMMATSKHNRSAPQQPMLSRLFLYWCERAIEHSTGSCLDTGKYLLHLLPAYRALAADVS